MLITIQSIKEKLDVDYVDETRSFIFVVTDATVYVFDRTTQRYLFKIERSKMGELFGIK